MKRRRMRILCIATVFALLFSCMSFQVGAQELNDGWLSITIGDDRNEFDPDGIRMAIYLIATGDYGDWTMEEPFDDITVFVRSDGSASVDKTLSQIRQRIADRKIKPTADGISDEKGKIEFKELVHGIYYIEMTAGPERLTMSAMLLSVPNSNGSVQVRAMAKYEYVTPTPSPTPTLKPTFTPFVPPVEPTTPAPEYSPTPTVTADETPSPTVPPDATPTASEAVTDTPAPSPTDNPTAAPTGKPANGTTEKPVTVTRKPVPTPAPEQHTDQTPAPKHVPTLQPRPGETTIALEEYEVALGLFNIQIHVGVCFE